MEYGPQTTEIRSLIEKVDLLTTGQMVELSIVGFSPYESRRGDDAWRVAWRVAWGAVLDAARLPALVATKNDIDEILMGALDVVWGAIRGVIYDAILALIVRDLISAEDFNTLYSPWRSVMGN